METSGVITSNPIIGLLILMVFSLGIVTMVKWMVGQLGRLFRVGRWQKQFAHDGQEYYTYGHPH